LVTATATAGDVAVAVSNYVIRVYLCSSVAKVDNTDSFDKNTTRIDNSKP
jgi:hypothetical protein